MLFNETAFDDPMFEAQVQLEEDMRHAGIERFRARLLKATENGEESSTMAGTRLTTTAHQRMVDGINAFVSAAKAGGAGRRHTAVKFVEALSVDVVANITLRNIIDHVTTGANLTTVAWGIAESLESEVNSQKFAEEMPKAHKVFLEKAKKQNTERRRWSHLLFPAKFLGVELVEWSAREKILVGTKLVDIFVEATGLMTIQLVRSAKGETTYKVKPTEQTLAWIAEENGRLETMFPVWMPTIIPPKPWTSPTEGAYYTIKNHSLTLVKTKNRAYLDELAHREMSCVYTAINALQETAWAINTRVMEVMNNLFEAGNCISGVPSADPLPLPVAPHWLPRDVRMAVEDMSPEQLLEFNAWKAETHRTHQQNAQQIHKRATYLRTMALAKRFQHEEALFFPHQLDWRGRAYPIPLYLNPQGSDIQRGLLHFAGGGEIVDQIAADWLAIHGAGCFGFDKASLEERVDWVKEHQDDIIASALDPYSSHFWEQADKPWQFLAFCFDWAGFCEEGWGYVSQLPIQMDGTCNGLQNFSAMLRDEIGGAAVNLVPADKPSDIYRSVSDIVAEMVAADIHSDEPVTAKGRGEDGEEIEMTLCTKGDIARGWHGQINRTVCKRPVMTLAYGARKFGFSGQIEEDTLKPWRQNDIETYPFILRQEGKKDFDYGFKAAIYLAGLIWEAVGKVVVAARAAMDWLQGVAQTVSKENLPINWVAPTGLLVQQAYRVPTLTRIDTTFKSTRIRLTVNTNEDAGKIDSRRQAAGISPNWVHSLDASHLARTIERAHQAGIRDFSMIHDSYGTHAANTGALALFLREEFVRMYSEQDVLQQFRNDLQVQTGTDLPATPAQGKLDLDQVLESAFFFA